MAKRTANRSAGRPPQQGRTGGGIGLWVRQRRTRSHLSYLPKWTARRPEPFGVQGLHWLPAPTGSRDPFALTLNGVKTVVAASDSKFPKGRVSLQYGQGVVKFRKVEIKPM